jgi:myosin heavy subunit
MTEFEERMAEAKKNAAELGLDKQAEFENFEARALAHEAGLNGDADVAMPRDIDVITEEIVFYKRQAGSAILEIGSRLNEAKSQLEHGQWLDWLREKVDLSERSAQNFMRLSREYGKSAEIADLGATKALALLALPESDRMNFAAEKHAVNGEEKSVGEMTSKELEQAIRERDAALAAQKTAETALSDAREKAEDAQKKAESAKAERDALSAKSDGLEEKLRKAKEREKNAKFTAEQADAAKLAAEKALQELREKPVDVAVGSRIRRRWTSSGPTPKQPPPKRCGRRRNSCMPPEKKPRTPRRKRMR